MLALVSVMGALWIVQLPLLPIIVLVCVEQSVLQEILNLVVTAEPKPARMTILGVHHALVRVVSQTLLNPAVTVEPRPARQKTVLGVLVQVKECVLLELPNPAVIVEPGFVAQAVIGVVHVLVRVVRQILLNPAVTVEPKSARMIVLGTLVRVRECVLRAPHILKSAVQ